MRNKMRLDKYLVHTGYGSRSEVQKLIKSKRVKINEEVIKKPEYNLNPEIDVVKVREEIVDYAEFYYYIMNKPQGCITATEDPKHQTVIDLLDSKVKGRNLSPVGRLDKDTEGLLILTNDGQFNHALLSPKSHVDKVYYAEVDGRVVEEDQRAFELGIDIGEKKVCMPAQLEIIEADDTFSKVYITIKEGKFHQVKRMMRVRGKEVTFLKRIKMGGLTLPEDLETGQYRLLTVQELQKLTQNLEK